MKSKNKHKKNYSVTSFRVSAPNPPKGLSMVGFRTGLIFSLCWLLITTAVRDAMLIPYSVTGCLLSIQWQRLRDLKDYLFSYHVIFFISNFRLWQAEHRILVALRTIAMEIPAWSGNGTRDGWKDDAPGWISDLEDYPEPHRDGITDGQFDSKPRLIRGCSSGGRAPDSHALGNTFHSLADRIVKQPDSHARGSSSVGSAPVLLLLAGGHRFDLVHLHRVMRCGYDCPDTGTGLKRGFRVSTIAVVTPVLSDNGIPNGGGAGGGKEARPYRSSDLEDHPEPYRDGMPDDRNSRPRLIRGCSSVGRAPALHECGQQCLGMVSYWAAAGMLRGLRALGTGPVFRNYWHSEKANTNKRDNQTFIIPISY